MRSNQIINFIYQMCKKFKFSIIVENNKLVITDFDDKKMKSLQNAEIRLNSKDKKKKDEDLDDEGNYKKVKLKHKKEDEN